MSLNAFLQYLGVAVAATVVYKTASFAYLFLRPSSLPRYHHGKPGQSWALVTGASDGIGHGFAQALCSRGFNVLLHGRNPNKLNRIKSELESQHPNLSIQTVIADAFDIDADIAGIAKVAESLPGKLTVLINNVGGAPIVPNFGALAEVDQSYVDKLLNLNARFPTQLTRALLPLLIENSPALVMNICSITGLRGLPYLTTYSASKSFNYCFTESLNTEMKAEGHDVEVLGIVVGNVISGGNRIRQGFTCSSLEMAEASLDRVGCGMANVFGWWRHAMQWMFFELSPAPLTEMILMKVMKTRRAEETKNA